MAIRLFFFLLVLANLLFNAWTQGYFGAPDDSHEPQRLTQQLNAEKLRIVREFHPHYLGLASEINTYADTHPDDFPNFLSLYNSVYDQVKAEAPDTQIFVTFQWEELNNLIQQVAKGRTPRQTDWNQLEIFEPKLDVWAISSYPFIVYKCGADIPADYYTPLLAQTSKQLGVAEGGFSSALVGPISGTPQDHVTILTPSIRNSAGTGWLSGSIC